MSHQSTGAVLTRQELYDQIWTEPMTAVAKKYGLSAVGLAKICRSFEIPKPPVGYWARLVAGKSADRPALPELEERDKIEIRAFRVGFEPDLDSEPLVEVPTVVVPDELIEPHAVVKRIKKEINATKADYRGILECDDSISPSFAVSKNSISRALRTLDTVYKSWEEFGGIVRSDDGALGNGDDFVQLAITESYRREEKPKKDRYFTEWVYFATDNLMLEIKGWCRDGMRRRWTDGKSQRLEQKLGNFLSTVPIWLEELRAKRHDKECRERQRALAEARRQVANKREARETAWRDDLLMRARDFETAARIRRYLAAVEKDIADGIIRPTDSEGFKRWMDWSHWYADFADPSVMTPPRIDGEDPPINTPIESLDLTSETRAILIGSEIRNTDELYQKAKHDLDVMNKHGPYQFHYELTEVLEGLGYDMTTKDWVWRRE